jgi:hypothetical protein
VTGEVLTAVPMKTDDFWDVVPCILVNSYRKCYPIFRFLAGEEDGASIPFRNVGKYLSVDRLNIP